MSEQLISEAKSENSLRPRTNREQAKQETRQRLLQASFDIMVEQGYEALTTSNVAARAGIRQPSFYVHFKDKNELLAEMATGVVNQLREALHLAREPMKSPGSNMLEGTRETYRLSVDTISRHKDILKLFMAERYRPNSFMGTRARSLMQDVANDLYQDIAEVQALSTISRKRLQFIAHALTEMTANVGLALVESGEDHEDIIDLLTQTTLGLLFGEQ